MSSSSVNQRRSCDSPCGFTYPRIWCMCVHPLRSKAEVHISDAPGNRGKLCYVCPSCREFRGWLVPLRPDEVLAKVELHYQPDISAHSPSQLLYKGSVCARVQCGHGVLTKISSTTKNPGKLYYSCGGCGQFAGWCLPVGRSIVRQTTLFLGATRGCGFVRDDTVDTLRVMIWRLVFMNMFLCLLLLIALIAVLV